MESEKDVVAAFCKCNKIVLAMTTDEYQRSGKPEIDSFFDMGYKIGRTTKAVARNLFGCECESQNTSTSDEALPIADVVKSLPSENKPRSMSKCMMCGKSNGCQCHGKW